eukprot:7457028-Pyramimonas_sp.AAC.1
MACSCRACCDSVHARRDIRELGRIRAIFGQLFYQDQEIGKGGVTVVIGVSLLGPRSSAGRRTSRSGAQQRKGNMVRLADAKQCFLVGFGLQLRLSMSIQIVGPET